MPVESKSSPAPRFIPSTRFLLALLVSFALFVQYAQRVSLSMAIVCMVNRTAIHSISTNESAPNMTMKHGPGFVSEKQIAWTEFQQQIVLGAHWLGYLLTLGPGLPMIFYRTAQLALATSVFFKGGWLSTKIGATRTFAFGLILSSIATLSMALLYFLNDFQFIVATILRVLAGFGHGPLFPATYTFWSMWAVPLERSTLTSIGFCSTNLGTSVTMLLGGILCRYVISGWIYIFILTGLFGFIWLPLWLWLATNSPVSHQRISEHERQYVCDKIGLNANDVTIKANSASSLPWKKIFRSKAVMALFFSQFCNLFGLFFFYTNVGKILTEIHRVPTQYTGYVLASGFILMPISSLSAGIIADRLVRAKKMTLTNVRKIFNSVASFGPSVCMIVLCFCDQSKQLLGITAILVYLFSSGMAYGSGYVVNFADIVPAYSSIIFSVAGTIATTGALISNIIAGVVLKRPILEDWRKLFIMFSVFHFIGGLVFVLFGSGVPRKWAIFKPQKQDTNTVEIEAEKMEMLEKIVEEEKEIPSNSKDKLSNST